MNFHIRCAARWVMGILFLFLLTSCYIKSGSQVKWVELNESGSATIVLEEADPSTFHILRHRSYAKDSMRAWYKGLKIEVANISSFKSIHSYYATDSTLAYYMRWSIDNSHGPSFEVIKGPWSKDRNDYHFRTRSISVCDRDSFRVYENYDNSWGLDNQCAYYKGRRLPLEERSSFTILSGGFSKDRLSVYYEDEVVEGADPMSFEMIGKTYIGRDKYRCYRSGEPFECPN